MKIYTKLEYVWDGEKYALVHEEGFDYSGPLALCDRAAQAAAKNAGTTAAGT